MCERNVTSSPLANLVAWQQSQSNRAIGAIPKVTIVLLFLFVAVAAPIADPAIMLVFEKMQQLVQ